MARLTKLDLPALGREEVLPDLPNDCRLARLSAAKRGMREAGLDFLVVYADREHAANICYLTGFDPRFEEALLLLDAHGQRRLLVGNECLGYLPDPALECEAELFQDLSLMGQSRRDSSPLRDIFSRFGIGPGCRVGCVGWKYFGVDLLDDPDSAIEIPSYIVDLLRQLCGDRNSVHNAGAIFMDPRRGLRVHNEVEQIARFEYAAIHTSQSVLDILRRLEVGASERELARRFYDADLTRTCHPMLGFGDKVKRGLASPSSRRAELGDAFTVAYGLTGALNCRAGVVARGPGDLTAELKAFFPEFVANYYDVVAAWYEAIGAGVQAGAVFAAAEARRDPGLFDFAVNPGHYLHLDEWVHSPFAPGSDIELASGMALQMDIIPVSRGPFCYANAEDGVVLADDALQTELAERYPACWDRVQARRRFMIEVLGIALQPTVLPLSNTPGWLPPYALDLDAAMAKD